MIQSTNEIFTEVKDSCMTHLWTHCSGHIISSSSISCQVWKIPQFRSKLPWVWIKSLIRAVIYIIYNINIYWQKQKALSLIGWTLGSNGQLHEAVLSHSWISKCWCSTDYATLPQAAGHIWLFILQKIEHMIVLLTAGWRLKWTRSNWRCFLEISGDPAAAVGETRWSAWGSGSQQQFTCLLIKCQPPRWPWFTTQKGLIQVNISSSHV